MAFDFLSLDLNIGERCHKEVINPTANSAEQSPSNDTLLDDAIYDFFKNEKIKFLKRKYNMNCMQDLLDLKKKKIDFFAVFEGAKSNAAIIENYSVTDFKYKLQRIYGHILSPQIQDAVCNCFQNYCTESSRELISSYESLIFSMINILINCNARNDGVQKVVPNASTVKIFGLSPAVDVNQHIISPTKPQVDMNQHIISPAKPQVDVNQHIISPAKPQVDVNQHIISPAKPQVDVNQHIISPAKPQVDVNQHIISPAKPQASVAPHDSHSKSSFLCNQQIPQKKSLINEGHLNSNRRVSFLDLNESLFDSLPDSSHKPEVSNALLSQPILEKSARAKYSGNEQVRKLNNSSINVIDLECADNSIKPSGSFSFRSPQHLICNDLAGNNCISPEVKFVCEKKFHDKLNTMCNKSNELYNENIIHLRQSYRRAKKGINEADDLSSADCSGNFSIVNEQYCSSLNNSTPSSIIKKYSLSKNFPVTKNDILIYLAACKLSNVDQYYDTIAADIGNVHVKFYSLGQSFAPGGKIGSFVINIICRKFFLDERPTISKKHYFFSSVADALMRDTSDFSYVKKCFDGAVSVVPLRSVKMLLFPVCYEDHWFVFIVDMKNKHFFFLDSNYSKTDGYQIVARKKLIKKFIQAWDEVVALDMPFKSFKVAYPHVPKQTNSVDCGVFVIKFLELWRFNADLTKEFSQSDICNIRVQILNDLLFSEHNCADISIIKECAQAALAKGWQKFKDSN